MSTMLQRDVTATAEAARPIRSHAGYGDLIAREWDAGELPETYPEGL